MHLQIEHLKDEIKVKDSELIKRHCEHTKVSKDMEKIRDHLDKTKKRQNQLQSVIRLGTRREAPGKSRRIGLVRSARGARRSQGFTYRSRAKKNLRIDSKSALNSAQKNGALRARNWKKPRILAFLELMSISGFD